MIADWVQGHAPAGGDGEIWTLATVLPYYRISSVLLPTHFSGFWEKIPHFNGKCSCPQKDGFLSASAVSDSSKCERTIGEN